MAIGRSGTGIEINKKAVLAIVGLAGLFILWSWSQNSVQRTTDKLRMFNSWKTEDEVEIPKDILDRMIGVDVQERRSSFEFEGQQISVSLYQAEPVKQTSDVPIVLLHGAGDSAEIWKRNVKTLQLSAAVGHRVFALDLPGWGGSANAKVKDKPGFLARFLQQRKIDRPIIVAPSMSGSYVIPYVMGDNPMECTSRVRGFVPISPTNTDLYSHAQYHRCEVPTLIVYGTEDKTLGLIALGNLRNMPNSEITPMQKQGHACYIKDPETWHKHFYNFLLGVEREHL